MTNVPGSRRPQLEPRGHGWLADPDVCPIREMALEGEGETREKGIERWERREWRREVERGECRVENETGRERQR